MTIFPRFTFVPIFRRDTFPLFIRSSPHPSTLPSLFLSPLSLSLSYQCNNTKATLRLSLDPLPSSTSIELHFLFITFHPFHSSSTLHPTTISHPSSPTFHFLPRQQQIPSPLFPFHSFHSPTRSATPCARIVVSNPLLAPPSTSSLYRTISSYPSSLSSSSRFHSPLPSRPTTTHLPPPQPSLARNPSCAATPFSTNESAGPKLFGVESSSDTVQPSSVAPFGRGCSRVGPVCTFPCSVFPAPQGERKKGRRKERERGGEWKGSGSPRSMVPIGEARQDRRKVDR